MRRFLVIFLMIFTQALAFGKGGFSSGGGHSFSSGGHSSSFSSGRSSFSSSSSGRSYSAPSKPSFSAPAAASRPSSTFDSAARNAARSNQSAASYSQYKAVQAPKPIQPSRSVVVLPDRTVRSQTVYRTYYSRPIVVRHVYHDSWNPYFWMWLADRSAHDQAIWIHNHRDQIDDDRYRELVNQNAQLAAEMNSLKNYPKDPNYVPPGMQRDLMYVDATPSPTPTATITPTPVPAAQEDTSNTGNWIAGTILAVLAGSLLVWFVFYRKKDYTA